MRAYSYNKRRAVNHDIGQILDDSVKEIKESSGSKNAFVAELKKHMDFEDMMKNGKSGVLKRDQDTYNRKMTRVRLYLKMLAMNGFTNIFTDVPDLEQIVYREAYVFKGMTFKKKRLNAAGILKEYTELCPWIKPKNEEEAEKAKEDIPSYGYFRIADIDYYNEVISLLLDNKKGYITKFAEMQSLLSTAKKTPLENEMIKRVSDYDKAAIDEIIAGLNSKECPFPPISVYVKLARLDESRLSFLYSKFKRGYMVNEGFLSVYEDYVQIRKNVMEELLFVYRFRDAIEIFKAVYFIGQACIDMIMDIFEPEED